MRTPYLDKCVCGHVRESHYESGEPWEEPCKRCGCMVFAFRRLFQYERNEDEE